MGASAALLASAILVFILWFLHNVFLRRGAPYPLPPGPPGRFLVGNLGQVSIEHPEQDYMRWGKQYNSDVVRTTVLGRHMICLNSVQAAADLLDRRGANYCSRPRFTLFEVMGWGLTLTFLPWGPRFKLHRRLIQAAFTHTSVRAYQPIQIQEARKAARALLADPADWRDTTLLLTTSIIFRIAFGQEVADKRSPYCAMAAAANDATTNGGIPGSSLVDVFPLARYLPDWMNVSAPLRHARRSRAAIRAIHDGPWAATMQDLQSGVAAGPSFMRTHWERFKENEKAGREQEATVADIKGATGAVFIAGGNPTWSMVLSCMLFLTKYPDVQRRVHEEIDEVVGEQRRLPNFDDRPRLAYLERFIQEVMRVLPANPLVIPHKSLHDDVYKGMFIPSGSAIFANAKAMNSDPATYADPDKFDPDRYERGEPYPQGNFGFGRRKCPGNLLATATVYIFLVTLMAAFELEKVVGPGGKPLEPEVGLTIGLGGHPTPFECKLKVRSPTMARLLQEDESSRGPEADGAS